MQSLVTFFVMLLIRQSFAVIYHLNDTEYDRMPPLASLDKYDECVHQPGGMYCLARFQLITDSQNELMRLIQEYSEYKKKHFNHTIVERGVCVIKSCSKFIKHRNLNNSEDLNQVIEMCVNASVWNTYGIEAKLSVLYNCDGYDQETKIDILDWVFAGIISCLIMLNLFGIIYDILSNNNNLETENNIGFTNRIILSFSIIRNWAWLTSSQSADDGLQDLKGIHCIKVILTCFVIAAHVIFLNASPFTENPHDFEKAYDSTCYQLIFTTMSAVQIFFTISGFLMVYKLQILDEKKKITWTMLPMIILWRFLRVFPAYIVVVGFTATWLRHLGSGPLWNYSITNSVSADCRRNWWLHLLSINNYVEIDNKCGIQTWYLAADTQLFALGLFTYMWTKSSGRNLILSLLILLGCVLPALHVWFFDLEGTVIMHPELYRSIQSDHLRWLYFPGQNNMASYIIGMSLGYYAYSLKNIKQLHNLLSNKVCELLICLIPILILKYCLIGRIFYEQERASLAVRMAFAAAQPIAVAGPIAVVILTLVIRLNGLPRRILEWHGWIIPGKLSFSVYLLHMNLVHIMLGLKHQLGYVSIFNLITNLFAVTSMSFLMAIPFHLIIEAPMGGLVKTAIIDKAVTKKQKCEFKVTTSMDSQTINDDPFDQIKTGMKHQPVYYPEVVFSVLTQLEIEPGTGSEATP